MTTNPPDLFAKHRLDLKAAADGVWIDIRGDRFKVARMGNDRCAVERAAFLAENALPPQSDIPDRLVKRWAARMFGRAILLDAKFAASPEVVYEPTIGEQIWSDPELAEVKNGILERASGDFTVRALQAEALLGNSLPSSNGSASAATSETR